MATQVTASHARGEPEPSAPLPVRLDYRARAAIRQLNTEDQAAIYDAIDALALRGLPALTREGRARLVVGLRVGDRQDPVYEMRALGAPDLRIFFVAPWSEGGTAFVVTDVLRRSALQNAARSF